MPKGALFGRYGLGLGLFLLGVAVGAGVVALRQASQPLSPSLNVGTVPLPKTPPARRLEATIFLPMTSNRERPFNDKDWNEALNLLVVEFGGVTLGSPLEGCWRDHTGQLQKEPVRPVIVSFEKDKLQRFRQLVNEIGQRLGQETIYTRFEEPRVELLPVQPVVVAKDR